MNRILTLGVCIFLFGCTQQQLNQSAAIVLPIAQAALVQYAASQGIPPSTSTALIGAAGELFGMSSVAYQGQPAATGTDLAPLASAVLAKLPAGTGAQQGAILLAAAQTLQAKVPTQP